MSDAPLICDSTPSELFDLSLTLTNRTLRLSWFMSSDTKVFWGGVIDVWWEVIQVLSLGS